MTTPAIEEETEAGDHPAVEARPGGGVREEVGGLEEEEEGAEGREDENEGNGNASLGVAEDGIRGTKAEDAERATELRPPLSGENRPEVKLEGEVST